MNRKILLTGVSGFIGRHLARELLHTKDEIIALIRPNTDNKRIEEFGTDVKFIELDLADTSALKEFLSINSFDVIIHIGALRGGRKFSKQAFLNTNVKATEQLIINAIVNNSNFIFCSSVGVFGAIPKELPATNKTQKQSDNYYHYTKIQAEALIQKYILQGLKAAIIRPAITYGKGDYGFPFTLAKLVDKKMMFLPKNEVKIHLTNIQLLTKAFIFLTNNDFETGEIYNVADEKPVVLKELVNFISNELHGKNYPKNRNINSCFFTFAEKVARIFKSELWISRFELISKSWYFDVKNTYENLPLKNSSTIPNFKIVIDWYKQQR